MLTTAMTAVEEETVTYERARAFAEMSTEAVPPIATYFRVCDGVRVRFADNRADSGVTVLLLAPWPESRFAFRRIWRPVTAVGRVVAIDLPASGAPMVART
jgi:pimeloyl-ACP methyl ester carboxylesterase